VLSEGRRNHTHLSEGLALASPTALRLTGSASRAHHGSRGYAAPRALDDTTPRLELRRGEETTPPCRRVGTCFADLPCASRLPSLANVFFTCASESSRRVSYLTRRAPSLAVLSEAWTRSTRRRNHTHLSEGSALASPTALRLTGSASRAHHGSRGYAALRTLDDTTPRLEHRRGEETTPPCRKGRHLLRLPRSG
jgi:hypothetical protein